MAGTALRDNIGIAAVSGGDKTNPRWEAQSGSDEFRRILKASMDSIGLLERARGEGRYSLRAVLESCSYSGAGFAVTTRVKYQLIDNGAAKELYQGSISSDYGNSVWDSLLRSKRSLEESSFRANIALLVEELSHLNLLQEAASVQQ